MSHELRTPLTAIKGYAEALLDDADEDEARQRFLDIIHRHAARMERLVKDLLRLARLDAGQELLESRRCDIAGARRRCGGRPRASRSPAKQLRVGCRRRRRRARSCADAAKIHDILRNLVENAVNYTQPGGAVQVSAAVSQGRFALEVADNGPGIPPKTCGACSSASTAWTSRAPGPAARGWAWRSSST